MVVAAESLQHLFATLSTDEDKTEVNLDYFMLVRMLVLSSTPVDRKKTWSLPSFSEREI